MVVPESPICSTVWDEFCHAYQRPLHRWLLAHMGNLHEAEEVVQSFFTKLHSKNHTLGSLGASTGKLRAWLLTPVPEQSRAETTEHHSSPGEIHDREWAFSLSRRALEGLRIEYQAHGKMELYEELLSVLDCPETLDRYAICKKLEISANYSVVAYMRFRERLAVRLREEVAATVSGNDAAEIDAKLRHLITILSHQGGLIVATIAS